MNQWDWMLFQIRNIFLSPFITENFFINTFKQTGSILCMNLKAQIYYFFSYFIFSHSSFLFLAKTQSEKPRRQEILCAFAPWRLCVKRTQAPNILKLLQLLVFHLELHQQLLYHHSLHLLLRKHLLYLLNSFYRLPTFRFCFPVYFSLLIFQMALVPLLLLPYQHPA